MRIQLAAAPFRAAFTRSYATAKAAVPKVDQRQLAAQREREQKRQQQKREVARALQKLKDEAREFRNLPTTMDISDAMRYIRAAEVGRPGHSATVSMQMRIVAERGVPKVTGAVRLPHGLKEEKVCVITSSPELADQARRAGAAMIGSDDILKLIREGGPFDVDRVYATPEMMGRVTQLARILGPKGLMPNAKRGTVISNVYDTIVAAKGETTFKQVNDMLILPVGRASFSDTEIVRNVLAATNTVRELLAAGPSAKKGSIGKALLSSTYSPSISVVV